MTERSRTSSTRQRSTTSFAEAFAAFESTRQLDLERSTLHHAELLRRSEAQRMRAEEKLEIRERELADAVDQQLRESKALHAQLLHTKDLLAHIVIERETIDAQCHALTAQRDGAVREAGDLRDQLHAARERLASIGDELTEVTSQRDAGNASLATLDVALRSAHRREHVLRTELEVLTEASERAEAVHRQVLAESITEADALSLEREALESVLTSRTVELRSLKRAFANALKRGSDQFDAHERLQAQLTEEMKRHASVLGEMSAQLVKLQQEAAAARSATIAARRKSDRAKSTLSFQLGHALVDARHWDGFRRLPRTLLALRRQAREGRFKGGRNRDRTESSANRDQLASEIDAVFAAQGLGAAEQRLLAVSRHADPLDIAHVYGQLAKLCVASDIAEACRLGKLSLSLDFRPTRRKWLAFLLFDAGHISEAAELLSSLPADERFSTSERVRAERIQGAHRLLRMGFDLDEASEPDPNPPSGPILYVAASALPYHISGYTSRTHGLLKAMVDAGRDVVCVTRPGYPDDRSDAAMRRVAECTTIDGVRYELLPGPSRRSCGLDEYMTKAADVIEAHARRLNASVIHAASNYESALPALQAARRLGVPFVYEVRGLWEITAASKRMGWESTEAFALDRRLETLVASHADAVFTLTAALGGELEGRGVEARRIALAPNAVDPAEFAPRSRDRALAASLSLPDDAFVVGYIGSVVGYEGLDDLVTAVASVLPKLPVLRLLIVGDGEALASLRDQVRALGIDGAVSFTGRVPRDSVLDYFSIVDAIVLPRKRHRVCELVSPLKPLEAMAMGVPLVVSDVAALKEMVRDGDTALVFPSGDPVALARHIESLAGSPDLRDRLARAGRADVSENSTWASVAAVIASTHERLRATDGIDRVPVVAAPRSAATAPAVTETPIVVLPPGSNAMSDAEKALLDVRLAQAHANRGAAGLLDFITRQCEGRSPRFHGFCLLKAAQAALSAGDEHGAKVLAERALMSDASTSVAHAAIKVIYNAADLARASTLATQVEAAGDVGAADRRFFEEVHGRRQLELLASQAARPRRYAAESKRVLNILAFSLPHTSVGYATRSHGLAQGIANAGWDIRPYTRPGFPLDERPELTAADVPPADTVDGITYRRLLTTQRNGSNEVEYLKAAIDEYERIIQHERPSVVHAASNYVTALPALIAARRQGVPFVYEVRGFWEVTRSSRDEQFVNTPKYRFMELFEGLVARNADRVITITTAMKEQLAARGVCPNRIDIAFNSVAPERFAPRERDEALASQLGLPSNVPVIGYVGSFVDYEGLDDLIDAAAVLQLSGADFRLLLVGDGAESASLAERVEARGLGRRAVLTGRVAHDEVERYYSLVDIAPFPRKPWEVCELVSPLKPFEAMALGKAVVVSSTRALTEIVAHETTGLVFEKGDVDSLSRVLGELVRNQSLRQRLGAAARDWILAERSWDVAGKVCAEAYARCI